MITLGDKVSIKTGFKTYFDGTITTFSDTSVEISNDTDDIMIPWSSIVCIIKKKSK